MSADVLLAKLDGVKSTGHDRWLARCPAHGDRSPSLSIRQLPDGRVLLHDFGGCSVDEVVTAAGLTISDLFPPRPIDHRKAPERRPVHAEDCLRAVAEEAQIAAIVAARVANSCEVGWEEIDRLMLAAARLATAALIGGIDHEDSRLRSQVKRRREHLAKAA